MAAIMQYDNDELFDAWHETPVRVRYAETDKMGVVYHANYLIWFEIGRTEFCRVRGFAYSDMEENEDAFLVVAESYCRYKASARYDEELIVRTHITELRRRSLRFGYEIVRASDGLVIAEGETGHVVTNRDGRVRSLPESYRELLMGEQASIHSSNVPPSRGERVPEGNAPD